MDFACFDQNHAAMKATDILAKRIGSLVTGHLFVLMNLVLGSATLGAETSNSVAVLRIDAAQVSSRISPMLYGLMTEEINYSYDGGLHAELVRNRTFKWNSTNAIYWHLVQDGSAVGSISIDTNETLNSALTASLKLEASQTGPGQTVGIANEGFWGIPVRPKTKYRASFYAKAASGFNGSLNVAIVNTNDATVSASKEVHRISDQWKKYEITLTTGNVKPSKDNRLVITTDRPGTVWFSLVSLFPPTFNNRPNGNRPDIMQLLCDMKPAFLRFPGGNYLEGNTIATRFDWKKTIGDISERPGHMNDAWRYWSTDGMGLLEFLEWCEDMKAEPVLGVYAGYSLRQQRVAPGPDLEPYVQDALDEIEYVTGSTKTKWGARRSKDGHPAPFKLRYVEVGNEDFFDRGTNSYEGRFAQFHDAIKAKYPQLQVIATMRVTNRGPDVIDDHFYRNSMQMQADTHHYDNTDRNGPKIFVGEWATREGSPTPNMNAALGDAAWMTGMERNSDIVIMHCYAPLFVNVSNLQGPGSSMQWRTDLIGYDALKSYGSPAYYAQKMFSLNRGDVVLPVVSKNMPTREWQPPAPRRAGQEQPLPPKQNVPTLFYNATREDRSGTVILKIVNTVGTEQGVRVEIVGTRGIAAKGEAIVLSAGKPEDTNSITEPTKLVPVTTVIDGLGTNFTRTFPPYSITVLRLKTR
jgi:alpha-N-arabinofuranosidase